MGATRRKRDPALVAAGAALEQLLQDVQEYRDMWQMRAERISSRGVNRTAVARVLTAYLERTGEARYHIRDERQLLDLVCRALDGQVLTPRTLRWFAEAFGFKDHEVHAIIDISGGALGPVASGRVVSGNSRLRTAQGEYRTLSLHHCATVSSSLGVERVRVVHVLEAIADGTSRCVIAADGHDITVEPVRGCRLGDVNGNRVGLDISRTLVSGDTHEIEYVVVSPPGGSTRTRYIPLGLALNVTVAVSFTSLPSRIRWCEWGSGAQQPTRDAPAGVGPDGQAHRFLSQVAGAAVGFDWSPDP